MRIRVLLLLIVWLWSFPASGWMAEKSADFQAGQRWSYTSKDQSQSVELVIRSFDGQSGWVQVTIQKSGADPVSMVNQEAPIDLDRGVYHIRFLCKQDGQNDYYDLMIFKPRKGTLRCEVYRNSQMRMAMGPLTLKVQ